MLKAIFAGNRIGGDDAVAGHVYDALKGKINGIEMLEVGVMGVDLISLVKEDDYLIVVDAVKAGSVGKVLLLKEEQLAGNDSVMSQHDFGMEQTLKMLRAYMPKLPEIKIVGITIKEAKPLAKELSKEMKEKLPYVVKEVENYLGFIYDM